MTKFEKDYIEALTGDGIVVLKERKAEIDSLKEEYLKSHGFRRTCIAQKIERLRSEYDKIESIVC